VPVKLYSVSYSYKHQRIVVIRWLIYGTSVVIIPYNFMFLGAACCQNPALN
jgi:hypothetical protein